MRIREIDYYVADDLGDALEKLQVLGPDARLLAGGTDLVMALKKKEIAPSTLISLQKLDQLDYVITENARLRIGALTTIATIETHELIREAFPLLSEAASLIGSWQIRNVATVGGNLCTASPSADSVTALLALDARVVIVEKEKEVELPLSSFITGPGKTVLRHDQLLKEIILDVPTGRSYGSYHKLMRRQAVDLAVVGVAFQAVLNRSGDRLERVGISLGGVAPTPIRVREAESLLEGLSCKDAIRLLPELGQRAMEASRPISDIRASAAYRRQMVQVYVQRAAERTLQELFYSEDRGK